MRTSSPGLNYGFAENSIASSINQSAEPVSYPRISQTRLSERLFLLRRFP